LRQRGPSVRLSSAVTSGALEESRRDEAKRETTGEEKLRLPPSEALGVIDQILDLMLTEVTRQTLGLLSGPVGVARHRFLSLSTELLTGLVRCVNDRVQAIDRPLLLTRQEGGSLFAGLVKRLTSLFLSLVDNWRRSCGHLIHGLTDLFLWAAGSLIRLRSHVRCVSGGTSGHSRPGSASRRPTRSNRRSIRSHRRWRGCRPISAPNWILHTHLATPIALL